MPGDKINSLDTGKGGFDIEVNGKEKNLSFDVGHPNAQGLDPTNPDHGNIKVDNFKKDISKKTKTTLAQYLSDQTQINRYPVEPPTNPVTEESFSDQVGNPVQITETNNDPHFTDTKFSPQLSSFSQEFTKASDLFKKGKKTTVSAVPDGNSLLLSVKKDKLPPALASYTNSVLSNNRFTAPNITDISNLLDNAAEMSTSYIGGRALGDSSVRGKSYSANELKQVGAMLSLRGSQEFPAAFNDKVNPTNDGSIAGALLPSPNQIGVLKVPVILLEAKDALEHLADNDSDAPTEISITPLGNQSWGALNNVEEPWSGTLNLGMIAMALAMQVALLLAFEGLGALIGAIGGGAAGQPNTATRMRSGRYVLGRYVAPINADSTSSIPPDIMTILGIRGTNFPFGDALKTGAAAFFVGAETAKEGVADQLAAAAKNAVNGALSDSSSAGFLIIVSRMIIRTGQTVAASVDKIASAFSSSPTSGIKGLMGLLDMIKNSKLIAAINIFSMLGDAILSEDQYSKNLESDPSEKSVFSAIDAASDDVAGSAVKKNRLKAGGLKLAWASNRSPSMYLLPSSIAAMTQAGSGKLGGFNGPLGARDINSRGMLLIQSNSDSSKNGSRIPRSSTDAEGLDVKKMEELLESEYVPFYFHDLRTNEIISFHAFLASLTDDYTASWEPSDGYGRVDPVKIYKSTSRRISMSFYVVATGDRDFDEMWLKINKLVTLLYPQYTKGRLLTNGKDTAFTQPFSQLIGASPLIRIRLGDLIKSNYSRFALARLFGAADNDMKLGGDSINFDNENNVNSSDSVTAVVTKLTNEARKDPASVYSLSSAGWASAPGDSVNVSGPSNPEQSSAMQIDGDDLIYFTFKIDKDLGDGTVVVKPELYKISELVSELGFDSISAKVLHSSLSFRYATEGSSTRVVSEKGTGYVVPISSLIMTPATAQKASRGNNSTVESIDKLSAFLDIEKNALVKSFRSIQGKGLAGCIDSMNFDWFDKVTWETKPGSRAPKMCKVTIAYSPIHDISPGLDHLGYNRSPLYPVGSTSGQGFDPDKTG